MIAARLLALHRQIEATAVQCGRDPSRIKLVAVAKRFPVEAILEAYAAGQRLFGENYLQEAAAKHARLPASAELHLIGHLQSNKAKTAAALFAMIETIDRLKIAQALNRHLQDQQRRMAILVQVNIGRDANKAGVLPEAAEDLLRALQDLSHLQIKGLMTIPPWCEDPEDSRPFFRDLRRLAEHLQQKGLFTGPGDYELSMGMSHDFTVAIEEGATIIRVGTAIFGERPA
ncbi:YggS family pyridoxal phosphate-dependent enzyme [Desulfofustis limnaeus]|jgi:pyridoxal phosphate enzyme (YggS family)|uniref:Pyridoxal phosphate homeostasis protein n=1 Tax=Desulfofustis limnaeus TaxID=2740163 RepID=A0ABM7W718_9BACT|nr:YggS family pyridoxal phosphate-dependent enzyme [Desulfofustis limnaeus]MDX9894392.1 YggS family pyridoxal phosphate-dependent enzyme [Desulfofustis sp.]BDD86734.1 YggS family pyridoxal phosphate enzyme [Desulfofustis limnaeus]